MQLDNQPRTRWSSECFVDAFHPSAALRAPLEPVNENHVVFRETTMRQEYSLSQHARLSVRGMFGDDRRPSSPCTLWSTDFFFHSRCTGTKTFQTVPPPHLFAFARNFSSLQLINASYRLLRRGSENSMYRNKEIVLTFPRNYKIRVFDRF